MKNLFYIIFFPFLIINISCEKWGAGFVEGVVYKAATGETMPNCDVKLYRDHNANTAYEQVHITTDANGHYKLNYYHKLTSVTNYRYFIKAYTPGTASGIGISDERLLTYKKMTVDLFLK